MNPNELTLDQCRDWLAEDDGWEKYVAGNSIVVWHKGDPASGDYYQHKDHPIPPTLDAAAAAMPEGWSTKLTIHKGHTQATGWPSEIGPIDAYIRGVHAIGGVFLEAPTELLARFRLAVACRLADKERKL